MQEQIKAILYDFKDAGWTVQRVEQELKFSNGSLGKKISDFRFCKLLELHKKEIKKPVTITKELEEKIAENNKPENKAKIEEEREIVNEASQKAKNPVSQKAASKFKVYDYSAMPQGLTYSGRESWKAKARIEQDKA